MSDNDPRLRAGTVRRLQLTPAQIPVLPYQGLYTDVFDNTGRQWVWNGTAYTLAGSSADWTSISGKPSTFPPSTHNHGAATSSSSGFMSAADKAKLNGIAPAATANDTDANLRNRQFHTGRSQREALVVAASRVLALEDSIEERLLIVDSANLVNITVPRNTTVGLPVGWRCELVRRGDGNVQFVPEDGTVVILAPNGTVMANKGSITRVVKIATNTFALEGEFAGGQAPVNTVAPSLSINGGGLPEVGKTFDVDDGDWSPSGTFSRQFYLDGVPLPGETSSSYTAQAGDVGKFLYFITTVTNSFGSRSAQSNGFIVIAAGSAVPQVQVPPSLAGSVQIGEQVTIRFGSYTNAPTGYLLRKEKNGAWDGAQTGPHAGPDLAYTNLASDAGANIRWQVTPQNGSGNGPAQWTPFHVVAAPAPQPISPPSINGNPVIGGTLTCDPGSWPANTIISFQWVRIDSQGAETAITGATNATYTPVDPVPPAVSDLNKRLYCRVTGSNGVNATVVSTSSVLISQTLPSGVSVYTGALPGGFVEAADEGQTMAAGGTVAYGEPGGTKFHLKTVPAGTACDNSVFGDPSPGAEKKCYVQVSGPPANNPAPTWVDKQSVTAGTGSSAAVNVPAGTGNLLVMAVHIVDATKTIVQPDTGVWTQRLKIASGSGTTDSRLEIYTRAVNNEPASYTVQFSGSCAHAVSIHKINGAYLSAAIDSIRGNFGADGPTLTALGLNTLSNNTLLMVFAAQRAGGGVTWEPITGWSARDVLDAGFPANMASYTKVQATAGQTGNLAIPGEAAAGDTWCTGFIAIAANAPAGGTPPPPPPGPNPPPPPPPPSGGVYFDNGVPVGGQVIFDDPNGIVVSPRLVGMHWTQFTDTYFGPQYGPSLGDQVRVNAWRVYGAMALYWDLTETAPGTYDWTEWDQANEFWERNGVQHVCWTLYGVPSFYQRRPETNVAGWSAQLPNSQTALRNFLTALTNRYPRIKMIEVANEVWTDIRGIGADPLVGFWAGTEAELRTLCDWVLDWRNQVRPDILIQSPSIPGTTTDHVNGIMAFFDNYPRSNEFDSFSAHAYHSTGDNIHTGPMAAYVQGIRQRFGSSKLVRDGEHGFFPPTSAVTAAMIYNTCVRAALMGLDGIDFFEYGSVGDDETNLGRPYDNPDRRIAFEEAALLAGARITRVMTGQGGKWRVEGYR